MVQCPTWIKVYTIELNQGEYFSYHLNSWMSIAGMEKCAQPYIYSAGNTLCRTDKVGGGNSA